MQPTGRIQDLEISFTDSFLSLFNPQQVRNQSARQAILDEPTMTRTHLLMKTSGQKQLVISLCELPTRWTPRAGMGNVTEVFGAQNSTKQRRSTCEEVRQEAKQHHDGGNASRRWRRGKEEMEVPGHDNRNFALFCCSCDDGGVVVAQKEAPPTRSI